MKNFEINYESQEEEYKGEEWAMPVDTSWLKKQLKYPIKMIKPNEVITKAKEITIHFNYPLDNAADFTFKSKNGFTRKKFYECIAKGYKRIYREEEADDGNPGHISGMYNRATSNGRYGIWGHDIGDLVIEGVEKRGKKFHLYIGS